MVDYTYTGSGQVIVSPSPGQTRGSGMRSVGTYESEEAARSAVSAGTSKGAIPGTTPEATETKTTADMTAEQQSKLPTSIGKRILSPAENIAMLQAPVGMVTDPTRAISSGAVGGYRVDITGRPSEYFLTEQKAQQFIEAQRLQQAVQAPSRQPIITQAPPSYLMPFQYVPPWQKHFHEQAIAQEQAALVSEHELNIMREKAAARPDLITKGIYDFTAKGAEQFHRDIFDPLIGYTPTAHPAIKVVRGAASFVTSLPSAVALGAAGIEAGIRKPLQTGKELPEALLYTGAGLVTQAKAEPFETAGMAAGMIITGRVAPRIIKAGADITKRAVGGMADIAKGTPKGIKAFAISEEAAVVFAKRKPVPKQILEPIKGEPVVVKPKIKEVIYLSESAFVKSQKALEAQRAANIYTGETKFDVMMERPTGIKLMSETERAKVIAKIKQESGLYKTEQIQKMYPSFAQFAATTAAMAAAQRQQTQQITGQLTGQQTRQITGQQTKQVTSQIAATLQIPDTQQKQDALTVPYVITKMIPIASTTQAYTPTSDISTIITPRQIPDEFPPDEVPPDYPEPPTITTPEVPRIPKTPETPRIPRTPEPKTPKIPKLIGDEEEELFGKKKKKKGKKYDMDKAISPDFWFPASLEAVTKEEFSLGGKRAVHIGRKEKKKTERLYGRLIKTGRAIPTKKQFKASDLLK